MTVANLLVFRAGVWSSPPDLPDPVLRRWWRGFSPMACATCCRFWRPCGWAKRSGSPAPWRVSRWWRALWVVVFVAIKFIGVAYLLFLAWKMWFAPTQVSKDELPSGQSPWRLFGAGLAVTLGNPKIMVFYLALLPTIVDLDRVGTAPGSS